MGRESGREGERGGAKEKGKKTDPVSWTIRRVPALTVRFFSRFSRVALSSPSVFFSRVA